MLEPDQQAPVPNAPSITTLYERPDLPGAPRLFQTYDGSVGMEFNNVICVYTIQRWVEMRVGQPLEPRQ